MHEFNLIYPEWASEKRCNRTLTSYDLMMKVFAEDREMKTSEVIASLSAQVPERTVKRCLSEAVDRGDLEMPKRGIYRRRSKSVSRASSIDVAQVTLSQKKGAVNAR